MISWQYLLRIIPFIKMTMKNGNHLGCLEFWVLQITDDLRRMRNKFYSDFKIFPSISIRNLFEGFRFLSFKSNVSRLKMLAEVFQRLVYFQWNQICKFYALCLCKFDSKFVYFCFTVMVLIRSICNSELAWIRSSKTLTF